jgi:hypothetical protein
MNSKRWGWAIVIVLGALSVGGCATTTAGPAPETATDTPRAVPTPTPRATGEPARAPEPVPTQVIAQARNVAYEGIRFTFDPAMAAQAAYEGSDLDALIRRFDTYIAEVEEQLTAQDASSFVPDLNVLDAMIQSLEVDDHNQDSGGK